MILQLEILMAVLLQEQPLKTSPMIGYALSVASARTTSHLRSNGYDLNFLTTTPS